MDREINTDKERENFNCVFILNQAVYFLHSKFASALLL